ncbi:MAG: metallophosphoesterase family protein [Candidatus Limnocylindria bacterium]|jgi:3',5'-cyclic AMP phosphodiesterase CpdA
MYRNDMTRKEIERAFAERSASDQRLLQSLQNCDRRHFLRTSLKFAGMAAAASLVPAHAFQLVNVASAATPAGAAPDVAFRFAYVSDSHLYARGMTHRFAKAVVKAVEDVNALDPQPDFVLFGGDLAQLGRADELALGQQILKGLKAPIRMMVGEHDWYLDLGEKWKEMFGPDHYSFDHKGVHFVVLNSVVEKDFWTAKGYTPEQRMAIVAGLDDSRQSPFEVGEPQREWLKQDLAKIDKKTPIIVFSHSPLYKLYKGWNFWTDDAEQVQAILKPFQTVTVIHGHTHQLLTNRIGNIQFHGLLSTAWPWPYAPEGLPAYTVQMVRPDPFNQFDGCGDGSVDVLAKGRVNKHYNLWSRNPRIVTAQELAGSSLPGGGYQGPSY